MRPLALIALIAVAACTQAPPPEPPKARVEPVLKTAGTILGQPIAYPDAPPDSRGEVTAVIVTLPPGASTGWHTHPVPLFGWMLEGELTVAYKGQGERTYRPGDALMEAIGTPHDGRNTGAGDVRILAVFMGAEGVPNSEKAE
jgi:quercetin dioxygenase-like cupin family protein